MGYMIDKLRDAFPPGVIIYDARSVFEGTVSLSAAINRAVYSVPVECWDDLDRLQEQVTRVLEADTLPFERETKNGARTVDLRPAVHHLAVDDRELVMTLGLGEGGYARAPEVATFLQDGLRLDVSALPFHRKRLFRVDDTGREIDPMEL